MEQTVKAAKEASLRSAVNVRRRKICLRLWSTVCVWILIKSIR